MLRQYSQNVHEERSMCRVTQAQVNPELVAFINSVISRRD